MSAVTVSYMYPRSRRVLSASTMTASTLNVQQSMKNEMHMSVFDFSHFLFLGKLSPDVRNTATLIHINFTQSKCVGLHTIKHSVKCSYVATVPLGWTAAERPCIMECSLRTSWHAASRSKVDNHGQDPVSCRDLS